MVLSCRVIKSGFFEVKRCALAVKVDVIVWCAAGNNGLSRSETGTSLVYYYHGGFVTFFCSSVCVCVPCSCESSRSGF